MNDQMKIGFIADLHVGNHNTCGGGYIAGLNERCQLVIDTIEAALHKANTLELDELVILGDVFDTHRPSPQMIAAVGNVFRIFDGQIRIIIGNHDQSSSAPGDHALAPLELLGHVTVVEKSTVIAGCYLIPFESGPAKDWLGPAIERAALGTFDSPRILCIHLGIHDQRLRDKHVWAAESDGAIDVDELDAICEKYGIQYTFAGDWHTHKYWQRNTRLEQVGALCPTGWDNAGLEGYGGLTVIQGVDVQRHEIPGPRFVKLKVGESPPHVIGGKVFARITAEPEHLADAQDWALSFAPDKNVGGVIVRLNKKSAENAARTAATQARSAETLSNAIDAYVAAMPLDEHVSRPRVLNCVRGYLK